MFFLALLRIKAELEFVNSLILIFLGWHPCITSLLLNLKAQHPVPHMTTLWLIELTIDLLLCILGYI